MPAPDDNRYADPAWDRAAAAREDPAWVSARLADPESRFYPIWRLKNFISEDARPQPIGLALKAVAPLLEDRVPMLLGVDGDRAHFAIDLSDIDDAERDLRTDGRLVDLRDAAMDMSHRDAALLALARGLSHWHATHAFCGTCGAATRSERAGHARRCQDKSCGKLHFPRTDPAVIMLVTDGDRCLLARRRIWPKPRRSTIAGFVEPGESLENAVRREVLEETGIEVGEVRYHSSQPWPFPSSLMVGFTATALTTDIAVDGEEIAEADWYRRDEIGPAVDAGRLILPPADSISRRLVLDWLAASQ